MTKLIIAIDGPAASGKGTLAREIAREFGFTYLDTGLLYRLVGLQILNMEGDPKKEEEAAEIARHLADNFRPEYLENPDLKSDEAGNAASQVAAHPSVRAALMDLQRNFPQTTDKPGVVVDGRDIGTVIFPDADLKYFVTADAEVRAKRRYEELKAANREEPYEKILHEMKLRDERDTGRKHAPTRKAEDAIELDTTELSIEDTLEKVKPQILKLSR